MTLFLSTFHNKIDKKGRVSVPASFRTALAESTFGGMVAFRSLTLPSIEGLSMDRMNALSDQTESLDLFSDNYNDLTASIFADATPLAFDNEGRILLTTPLREHAELEENVAFVGRGKTFQLWNPSLFEKYQQSARERLKKSPPKIPPFRPRKEEA